MLAERKQRVTTRRGSGGVDHFIDGYKKAKNVESKKKTTDFFSVWFISSLSSNEGGLK